MDDAGHRAFQVIADRVGILGRVALELADIRHELPRDRIVGVGTSISSAMAGVTATA